MSQINFKPSSALAVLLCLCLASSVQGEPEAAPPRAGEELPARTDGALAVHVPPQLVARLTSLEGERRLKRSQASDAKAWVASRAQRAAQHRREIAEIWGSVVHSIDGQAKLRLHAERMSRLNRMLDLAEPAADKALVTRIRTDIKRELVRHVKAMQATRAASGAP